MTEFKLFVFILSISTTHLVNAGSFFQPGNCVRADEYTKLRISCPPGTQIVVNRAWYGDLDPAVCSSNCLNGFKCFRDATAKLASICGNRNGCEVDSSNDLVGDPCFGIVKKLDVDYQCQPEFGGVPVGPAVLPGLPAVPGTPKLTACEGTTLTIACPPNTQIVVNNAFYGRLEAGGACPINGGNGAHTCFRDATGTVQAACNSKSLCSVAADNNVFGDPCFGIVKYLEANYNCIPVVPIIV